MPIPETLEQGYAHPHPVPMSVSLSYLACPPSPLLLEQAGALTQPHT